MNYRIKVITGSGQTGGGTYIALAMEDEAKERILAYACDKFGGCTFHHSVGAWVGPQARVITERGLTIEILCESPLQSPDAKPDIHLKYVVEQATAFAQFVKSALQQTSVVLSVEKLDYAVFVS